VVAIGRCASGVLLFSALARFFDRQLAVGLEGLADAGAPGWPSGWFGDDGGVGVV